MRRYLPARLTFAVVGVADERELGLRFVRHLRRGRTISADADEDSKSGSPHRPPIELFPLWGIEVSAT